MAASLTGTSLERCEVEGMIRVRGWLEDWVTSGDGFVAGAEFFEEGDCGVATRSRSISRTSSILAFILSMSVSNCDLSCSMARSDVVVVCVLLLRREDLECFDDLDLIERRE